MTARLGWGKNVSDQPSAVRVAYMKGWSLLLRNGSGLGSKPASFIIGPSYQGDGRLGWRVLVESLAGNFSHLRPYAAKIVQRQLPKYQQVFTLTVTVINSCHAMKHRQQSSLGKLDNVISILHVICFGWQIQQDDAWSVRPGSVVKVCNKPSFSKGYN